jgi:hypothetical protein
MAEALILQVLELRSQCNQPLSGDVLQKVHHVRSICKNAEHAEGNAQISWRRGVPGSGSGSGQSRWRGHSHSSHSNQPSSEKSGRYVSKFVNTEAPVEDKILNQVILNKLNKFSASNYNEIKQFLEQILDSNEKDFLHDFMLLVFKKAASEPTFCPLYAKMISELSVKYSDLRNELSELYKKYMDIFEEVTEDKCTSYEQFVQRNKEKLHRLGYSQFLGELTSLGVLELEHLNNLYTKILDQIKHHSSHGEAKTKLVEEYVDCLFKMTKAFQKGTMNTIRTQLSQSCQPIMEDILANRTSKYPGLSKKGSFGIMDCLDIFRCVK